MSKPAAFGREPDVDVRAGGLRRRLRQIVHGVAHRRAPCTGSRTASRARRAARCRNGRRGSRAGRTRRRSSSAISRGSPPRRQSLRRIGQRGNQRIALEIHLRDEPLRPAVARDRVVDVRGTPVVDAVAPRVGAGLDGAEEVVAVRVGQRAAAAAEIRIDRRDVPVLLVPVAAAGVRLPDLDQRVAHRPAVSRRSTWPWTMMRSPIGQRRPSRS